MVVHNMMMDLVEQEKNMIMTHYRSYSPDKTVCQVDTESRRIVIMGSR